MYNVLCKLPSGRVSFGFGHDFKARERWVGGWTNSSHKAEKVPESWRQCVWERRVGIEVGGR
jgi:hypothetical protein